MISKLAIVISGQVVRENSANLKSFWRGFINIQNAIYEIDEIKVVAHSWNPEFNKLVQNVYNPVALSSEKQPSFSKDIMSTIDPVDKFEDGLNRVMSIWKRCSAQNILGNAKSRSKAIELLKKVKIEDDFYVLSARWDQGCSGSESVNKIIFDKSLPKDYLYLSYYSEVDEGYADMWFLTSFDNALIFSGYDKYVIECLGGKNNFFNNFTNGNWPLSIKKEKKRRVASKILLKIIKLLNFKIYSKYIPVVCKIINIIEVKISAKVEMPAITGENYLTISSKTNVKFPAFQALNNHAILKSFVIDKNLRSNTRFLELNDFDSVHKGQMINPLSFVYVVYSHSSFSDCWKMAVIQAKENLPNSCATVFLVSDESKATRGEFKRIFQNNENGLKLITYKDKDEYTNRLIHVFKEISHVSNFIYFVHEDMPLLSKVNEVYLNTLLHFLNNSNEYYIKLVDTSLVNLKEEHDSFPGLVKNYGGYSISVQPGLFKADYYISFLESFNESIYDFERTCVKSNFIFSAVKGSVKVGKYLISNGYFPHIATAISKGKWCTTEWGDEILYLSNKYNIDLSARGEV